MVAVDVRLEFGLGGGAFAPEGFNPDAFGGSDWINIIGDIRTQDPIICEYGITNDDPTELVPPPGTLKFSLNNMQTGAHPAGWYSPLNAIKRSGFDFNIPTRLVITQVGGGTPYYKFSGRLADIDVVPGIEEDRLVRCAAVDLWDDYSRLPVPAIATQFNKRGDELVQMILNALPAELQPTNRSITTSPETHAIAMDRAQQDKTIREAIYEVCASEQATALTIGSTVPGGLFVYRSRQHAALNPLVMHAFEHDIARNGLDMPSSRDEIVSKVHVLVHPTRVDAEDVLWELQTTELVIAPGETNDSVFGSYRDPGTRNAEDRIGGTDMVQPVAGTDYTMHEDAAGSGAVLTGSFTVTADYSNATGVTFSITNNGSVPAYVTKLQCRGKGINRSTALIPKQVPNVPYGHRVLTVDMFYQNSINVGQDVAAYYTNIISQLYGRVKSIRFEATKTSTLLGIALALEPGSRISITEALSGLDETEFTITGVRLEIVPADSRGQGTPAAIWCVWYLRAADAQRYWILGTTGSSELGATTVLGY